MIIFPSLHTFQQSSCAFYLLIMPVANLDHLLTSLLTDIMICAFKIDSKLMSISFYKFRNFDDLIRPLGSSCAVPKIFANYF